MQMSTNGWRPRLPDTETICFICSANDKLKFVGHLEEVVMVTTAEERIDFHSLSTLNR